VGLPLDGLFCFRPLPFFSLLGFRPWSWVFFPLLPASFPDLVGFVLFVSLLNKGNATSVPHSLLMCLFAFCER
jgi:hypothetical protein